VNFLALQYIRCGPVSFFHLGNQLVCRELSFDDKDELFDGILAAVDVQQAANHYGQTRRIHLVDNTIQIQVYTDCCLLGW